MSRTPIRWEKVTAISTAAGTIALIATVLVARKQITEARNDVNTQITDARAEVKSQITEIRDESKAQHLVEETSRFDVSPLLTQRRELAEKRIAHSKNGKLRPMTYDEAPPVLWDVLNNCDHIGLLTRRGYLDVSDVWNEMGYWILNIYADAEPVIESDRKGDPSSDRRGNPASMMNCSWLIEQIRPIESKENNGADLHLGQDDLYAFYEAELAARPGELTTRKPR
jgi:hypothetical protein